MGTIRLYIPVVLWGHMTFANYGVVLGGFQVLWISFGQAGGCGVQ